LTSIRTCIDMDWGVTKTNLQSNTPQHMWIEINTRIPKQYLRSSPTVSLDKDSNIGKPFKHILVSIPYHSSLIIRTAHMFGSE
jgi:hypothetical protein